MQKAENKLKIILLFLSVIKLYKLKYLKEAVFQFYHVPLKDRTLSWEKLFESLPLDAIGRLVFTFMKIKVNTFSM